MQLLRNTQLGEQGELCQVIVHISLAQNGVGRVVVQKDLLDPAVFVIGEFLCKRLRNLQLPEARIIYRLTCLRSYWLVFAVQKDIAPVFLLLQAAR